MFIQACYLKALLSQVFRGKEIEDILLCRHAAGFGGLP